MYLFLEDLPPINVLSMKGNQDVITTTFYNKDTHTFSTTEVKSIESVGDGISIRFRLPDYAKKVYSMMFPLCTQPIPNKHTLYPPIEHEG